MILWTIISLPNTTLNFEVSMDALKEQLEKDVDELSDRVGEFIRYWGFKKIHGKIWCHLYLNKEPLDAGQLICKIGVSKALISQSLAELVEYKVIITIDENKKKKRYLPNKKIISVITSILRQREQLILGDVMRDFRNVENFSQEHLEMVGIEKDQLCKLGNMITFADRFLGSMLRFESISLKAFRKIFE